MTFFVGTDIETVARFSRLMVEKPRLISRIFHSREVEYAFSRNNPEQSLAGIWCAKEAVLKAFGTLEPLSPRCIEIIPDKSGMPKVKITNDKLAMARYQVTVSISHTADYATSTALLIFFDS